MMKLVLTLLIMIMALGSQTSFADDPPTDVPEDSLRANAAKPSEATASDPVAREAENQPKPENGTFRSIVPLAGYNPTYGIFLGGGYFRKTVEDNREKANWGLIAVISQFRKAVKTEFRGEARLGPHWRTEWRNEIDNAYESNFGLGNETKVQNRVDVPYWKNELEWYFPYYFNDRVAVGPGIEHRARRNDRMYSNERSVQTDPVAHEEFTVAAVLLERLDYRNIPENPSLGWSQEFRVTQVWPYGGPVKKPFLMVDLEVSVFQYLLARDLVLAYNLAGGQIFGTPTWLNEFRLGGTDRLRGYFYGRFRGSSYYLEQTELRFPIFGRFSGVVFGEFGEVTAREKDPFTRAHVSYGGGLRIGLPPDNVAKMRIDYAIGRDQRGVFVDFGHAF